MFGGFFGLVGVVWCVALRELWILPVKRINVGLSSRAQSRDPAPA